MLYIYTFKNNIKKKKKKNNNFKSRPFEIIIFHIKYNTYLRWT